MAPWAERPLRCLRAVAALGAALFAVPLLAQPISLGADPNAPQRRTAVVEVAERVAIAVVNVHADEVVQTRVRTGDDFDSFLRDFMAPRYREEYATTSLGSGVLVDPHHVVTNHHVVAQAARVRVRLNDRREYACTLVGSDPDLDIAVLRLQTEEDLPYIGLADSADIMVGETVIAIGNPFGLGHTVTTGVVSALHRTVQAPDRIYHDFLQTDASINPGNSGGPLLDIQGRLVGINTAIYGRAQGIGFAIPVNRVKRIADEIINTGGVRNGFLGLELKPVTKEIAKAHDLPRPEGVLVVLVDDEGPAAKAGLERDDIILSLEGFPVLSERHFGAKMRDYPPGSTLELQVLRKGEMKTLSLKAGVAPAGFARRVLQQQLGLEVQLATDENAEDLGVGDARGLVVTEVRKKSAGDKANIKKGDIITGLGDEDVKDDKSLDAALNKARRQGLMRIVLTREGRTLSAQFQL